ncbi:MAG: hypothetical protein JWR19_1152 [Pedosphaera sp.]|nr:hypothetical protein [Pedosphaera sp.]
MKFILDMVHHNPGEPLFQSAFLNPAHLVDYGYNGQVFKHINCVATFAASGVDVFPEGSPDRAWLEEFTPHIEQEIAAAKAQGLKVFYHIDLFVLPKRLVEHFKAEICDLQTGRILLDRPRTLELHRVMFDELTVRFPQVDGYIIRVGETYLYDTPYHVGSGPIPRLGPAWTPEYFYQERLDENPAKPNWSGAQTEAYVKLIRFLRNEVCARHDKFLMFRTWDIFPDKLHARLDHYLEVTDQIKPHEKLIFSIKHTALDFWRHVKVNECLTRGKHPQIIEVQCQREYEGKGAYPNYVMDGVINGFEENAKKTGLKDLAANPQIKGIFGWSRGGGWYGPYSRCELWPDLNAYVLGKFAQTPTRSEGEIFCSYARERLKLKGMDVKRFRHLCQLSSQAILKGRYCEAFDRSLNESILPTACWMRDDRLGGRTQLKLVFDYLHKQNLFNEALQEKAEAVALWAKIEKLASEIGWPEDELGGFVMVSAQYGHLLFSIAHAGWRALAAGYVGDSTGHYNCEEILDASESYSACWRKYQVLASSPLCATPYKGRYFSLPGMPLVAGLDESVAHYEHLARRGNGHAQNQPDGCKNHFDSAATKTAGGNTKRF